MRKRLSNPASYRSRSAFKLLEIDARYHFLTKDVDVVVDLGAAPGGWSQVVAGKFGWSPSAPQIPRLSTGVAEEKVLISEDSESLWSDSPPPLVEEPKLKKKKSTNPTPDVFDPLNIDNMDLSSCSGRGTIIAVDMLHVLPISGVQTVRGDFLEENTLQLIHGLIKANNNQQPKVDVILSDMAANTSGNMVHDSQSSLEICEAVFDFATRNLRTVDKIGKRKGVLLYEFHYNFGILFDAFSASMKFFSHPLLHQFRQEKLQPNFHKTYIVKPPSSRASSSEAYFLCQGWNPVL